jgi:hypothetical protein
MRPRTVWSVSNLQPLIALHQILDGKAATHSLDQPSQQRDQFNFRVVDDLELISDRLSALDLEYVHGDHRTRQTRPKMELVLLAGAVGHHDRFEPKILEALQAPRACYLGVKALVAKLPVTVLSGAAIHDIVAGYFAAARLAMRYVATRHPR